ncbi:hypothetical protein GCM10010294_66080 [Streptomyces griseoloalbus]|nr:hypothetical protein GCM10010294_66080 [Streptomyces griseoloalbus]
MGAVYRVGEPPRAALLRGERRRVTCDRRLTYVVVAQVGEGHRTALGPGPDLDLRTLRRYRASPCGRTGYCMIGKFEGRVGNSVRIPVVVSYGCGHPSRVRQSEEGAERPQDHPH